MTKASDKIYRVTQEQVDQTLLACLRQWLPGQVSWNGARGVLKSRRVLVNGNLCQDEGRRLRATDVIKVLAHPAAPVAREADVVIRHLDRHLVVVEKPSGLTSVRHAEERQWSGKRRQNSPTLEDLLPRIIAKREASRTRQQGGKQRGRPAGPPPRAVGRTHPVRPVHRLDRDTSGLMVFARTVPAERHLVHQFRNHTTQRRYLAVVAGDVKSQTIRSNLVRDRGDGRRGSTQDPQVGKPAVTHVKLLQRLGGYSLIECRLETGRTHQIRIHLSELGHAVCGDKVYGPRGGDGSGAPRLALHAAELQFEHPETSRTVTFDMPLPPDLRAFIDRLSR